MAITSAVFMNASTAVTSSSNFSIVQFNKIGGEAIIPFDERLVNVIVIAPILFFGLVGNIIVVWIISTGKHHTQRTKSNTYVLSLAIADFVFLLSGPGLNFLRYANGTKQWLLPDLFCKVFVFSSYASANSGALIIACFSVERFLAVHFPLWLYKTMTLTKQLTVVTLAVFISTVYSAIWLVAVEVSQRSGECTFSSKRTRKEYLFLFLIDIVAFFAIPVFVTILANGFIIYRILVVGFDEDVLPSSQLPRISPTGSGDYSSMQRHGVGTRTSNSSVKQGSQGGGSSGDSKLATKTLVAVAVIFVVTCAPYRIFVIVNSFFGHLADTPMRIWLSHFCRWLWYFNSAVDPVIYNILSKRFRKSILVLCMANGRCLPNGRLKRTLGGSSRLQMTENNSLIISTPVIGVDGATLRHAQFSLLYMKDSPSLGTPRASTPQSMKRLRMLQLPQHQIITKDSSNSGVEKSTILRSPTDSVTTTNSRVNKLHQDLATPEPEDTGIVFSAAGWS